MPSDDVYVWQRQYADSPMWSHVTGYLNPSLASATNLEQVMGQTWSANKVLLDMDKTNYIDSTAIRWLISCHKEFKNKGGVFVVHSVQPAVRQVLDLLKIGKVVPIVENEAAARAFAIGAA